MTLNRFDNLKNMSIILNSAYMESLVTYNICLKLSYVTLQVFELHVSDCAHILLFRLDGLK